MGDGVGVPALGQHRDRDDAAHGLAQAPHAADGVHNLAQQVLVGDHLRRGTRALALHLLTPELLDLRADRGAERRVERFA